jgi:hypothetical protein
MILGRDASRLASCGGDDIDTRMAELGICLYSAPLLSSRTWRLLMGNWNPVRGDLSLLSCARRMAAAQYPERRHDDRAVSARRRGRHGGASGRRRWRAS